MIKINKKKVLVCISIVIFLIVFIMISKNIEIEKVEEISPESEISVEDEKQVSVVGYVLNTVSSTIDKKEFIINQKEIVDDMYKNILNKIIVKDESEDNKTVNEIYEINVDKCVEENGVLSIYLKNDILDFEKIDIKEREYIFEMINKTMLEINEITDIRYFFNDKEYVVNNV